MLFTRDPKFILETRRQQKDNIIKEIHKSRWREGEILPGYLGGLSQQYREN